MVKSIRELLVHSGRINEEILPPPEKLLNGSFENLGRQLVQEGVISEEDLLEILSNELNIPLVSLKDVRPGELVMVDNLSEKFMRHGRFVPLSVTDGTLLIAISDPFDVYALDAIHQVTGYRVEVRLAKESEILDLIDKAFSADATSMERIIEDIGKDDRQELGLEDDSDVDHLKDMASEAPVIRLVNLLISRAIEVKASDIHFEPFEGSFTVRYRIDGILHDVESPPRRLQAAVISRIKIMSKLNIAERRLPQDGRIKLRVLGKEVDFRVSTIPTLFGESVVLRILDRESVVLDLAKLGFPPDTLKPFRDFIARPYGIILVTGPTGSGKTTTLYGSLSEINSPDKKIITVEDPIEYQLKGINQIQVKPAIGLTFASALRSILRQDPDVVMIGEIRDAETAEIAIHSALTGHLVFSTLHTNDAAGAVTRLLEMGMENYLISSSLIGVLAQRLVRVVCSHCGRPHSPDTETLKEMGVDVADVANAKIMEGAGCEKCASTGYKGRTGIYELLPVTDEIRELILARADANAIKERGRRLGMKTLREAGWTKAREGTTTISELIRVTQVEG
jgi:general secretion pathway protein E